MGLGAGALENLVRHPDPAFWRGKRVLLTGHTGFKGSWLATWLVRLGASVTGVALPPATAPNLFDLCDLDRRIDSRFCDLRDADALAQVVTDTAPEIVLHLAAQALVSAGYRDATGTFATNVMGTVNLLAALRERPEIRSIVVVTSDKVYAESDRRHRETNSLGGSDPYSASKAACELIVASWRVSYLTTGQIGLATARAGNVIGGGDWAEDRIIPDAIRAWQADEPLALRRPYAVRPWQHVLEPLAGYLVLAQHIWQRPSDSGAFNFAPRASDEFTVADLVDRARAVYGTGAEVICRSSEMAEIDCLRLDGRKAEKLLGVAPRWSAATAVDRTIAWYRGHARGTAADVLCARDIDAFEAEG